MMNWASSGTDETSRLSYWHQGQMFYAADLLYYAPTSEKPKGTGRRIRLHLEIKTAISQGRIRHKIFSETSARGIFRLTNTGALSQVLADMERAGQEKSTRTDWDLMSDGVYNLSLVPIGICILWRS